MIINSITNTNFQRRTLVNNNNNNNNLKGNISSQGPNNDSPAKLPPLYTASVYMPRFAGSQNLFYVCKITSSSSNMIIPRPQVIDSADMEEIFNNNPNGIIMKIRDSVPQNIANIVISALQHLLKNHGEPYLEKSKRSYFILAPTSRTSFVDFSKDNPNSIYLNSLKINKDSTPEEIFNPILNSTPEEIFNAILKRLQDKSCRFSGDLEPLEERYAEVARKENEDWKSLDENNLIERIFSKHQ